ncbi:MAG: hypothetical protein AABZ02_04970 [Bacteroidota bacterium]
MRFVALLSVLLVSPLYSQVVDPDDPTGAIEAQLTSAVKNQFGSEYTLGFQVLDSVIARNGSTSDNGELSDPYGTLKGYILFGADKTESFDDQHGIMGLYKNGQIVWHSDSVMKGYWGGTFAIKDINQDGKVDILVEWTPGMQLFSVRHLWIISWNGTTGTVINQTNPENGNTTIHASESMFDLISIDTSSAMLVRGFWPDEEDFLEWFPDKQFSTMPYVTYSWNGSQYGLWPDTRQIPRNEYLPANLLRVNPSCKVIEELDSLKYHYVFKNAASSRQSFAKIALVGLSADYSQIAPAKWDYRGYMMTRPVAYWASSLVARSSAVRPGDKTEFRVASKNIPGIIRFYAQGSRPSLRATPLTVDPTIADQFVADLLNNSFVGSTVGPVKLLSPYIPIDFLDTLSSFTTQSRSLGWIKDQPTADKYLGYFNSARAALQQNNASAARSALKQVLRNVDVDSSSTLTSEAYALLRFNTEYLVSQLPSELTIDDLIAMKHEAYEKKWVGDDHFVKELDNGLENAKKHLARGDSVNCGKELEKFQEKVKREYDKTVENRKKNKPRDKRFVTEEGYASLTKGAQSIIDRLPQKRKK